MPKQYTRREFSKVAATTAAFSFHDDGDDEGSIIDRIIGDDGGSSSNAEGVVYVDVEDELETVNPGPNEVFITTDTEKIFKPTDDGNWAEFASLGGDSPWVKDDSGALTPENGEPVSVGQIANLTEFYTPEDGKFHTVDESTFLSLIDNYNVVVTPAGAHSNPPGITLSSTKTLTKANHDNTEIICPTESPSTRTFEIKPSGDFPAFDWTEDLGGLTFYGLWFNGANLANTTDLLTVGDGYLLRMEKCLFDSGGQRAFTVTGSLHSSTVTDCRFNSFADAGLAITAKVGRLYITDNYFGEMLSDKGVYISTSSRVDATFAQNTVSLTGGDGFKVSGSGPDSRLRIGPGNIVQGAGGIGISSIEGPVVTGNVVYGSAGAAGIRAGPVKHCTVFGNDQHGIEAQSNSAYIGNTVVNNSQSSAGSYNGLDINFDDNVVAYLNQIYDDQSTATQQYGINVASSNDVELGPNYLSGHATGPINDGGTRTRIRETVFLGAAPSGSNYGADDAGTTILDTSVSPADEYIVDDGGALLGPL